MYQINQQEHTRRESDLLGVEIKRCHDFPKRTGTDRNGPMKIPKRTSVGTETDRNGLQWVPKRIGTDFSSYRNEIQSEPEKVELGTIGTILPKMYVLVGRYVGMYVGR